MAHHMSDLPDFMRDQAKREELGATGEFPLGKIHDEDEGELRMAVAADRDLNRLLINFGKPVAFVGLTKEQALDFARMITEKAGDLG